MLTAPAWLDTPTPADLGIEGEATGAELWNRQDLGGFARGFGADPPLQGAGADRICPRP